MANDRAFIVTYTGEGVVTLPSVGIFQAGTRAWVDADTAETARRLGHFVVTGSDGEGIGARVVDELPPPAPSPPPPPQPRPPRRTRQSAVMAAVRSDTTTAMDATSKDAHKK